MRKKAMSSISRESIEKAYEQGIEAIIVLIESIVKEYGRQVQELSKRLEELENQKAKNSKNSHQPPSTDGFGKQTKSLRKKSERKVGGQEGHEGHNLGWQETADIVIKHEVVECQVCGYDLSEVVGEVVEKRQVHDLPVIKVQVTEHQIEKKCCPQCDLVRVSKFPKTVEHWVQYGENIKGLVTYLNQYQLIPSQRVQELMKEVFDCEIGEGTIYNLAQKCYQILEPIEAKIKEQIQESEVTGFDETGTKVNGKGLWLHVSSTKTHTHYQVHEKRGQAAMDDIGILPNYKGKAVHDGFKSYNQYQCSHYLCNAHHLRELTFIHERFNQPWAQEMIDLLCNINDAVKQAKLDQQTALEPSKITTFELQFQKIIDLGYKDNPEPVLDPNAPKTRGRPKRPKPLNLILRLDLQRAQVLGFMYDFAIPFDNNLAERDIRMTKVKLKTSGCFRSLKGANAFARIRGYISTLRKQALDILDSLTNLFRGNPLWV
jgi:transposase